MFRFYVTESRLADAETDVGFGGRLAGYKYYDMDEAIEAVLLIAGSFSFFNAFISTMPLPFLPEGIRKNISDLELCLFMSSILLLMKNCVVIYNTFIQRLNCFQHIK
jgi:hypothetical protein